ncbi:MAG: glycosyl hydrolase family 18 protein [Clostridia bacterium]|nr:glycosyl hydrolase family 18 protein [Clostridia bacterium]
MSLKKKGASRKVLAFLLCFSIVFSLFLFTSVSPASAAYDQWKDGQAYKVGDVVLYEGKYYQCLMAHTSNPEWIPSKSATLWKVLPPPTNTPRPTNTPGGPTDTPWPLDPPTSDGKKMVVGYYPEWGVYQGHNMYNVANIPFDKLTHINYAFATTKNGRIAMFDEWAATGITFGGSWDSPYNGTYGQFKKFKAQYPKTKVLISVGGWTQSGGFHAIAMTESSRATFADSCVAFCREWGFDGVDIDWEYPCVARDPDKIDNENDQGNPAGPEDKRNYTLLLKTLREKLDAASIDDGKRYQLTVAAAAGFDKISLTEVELFTPYLDFVNLMTYDMHGAWEETTNHQAPLYPNPKDPTSADVAQKYNVDWAVKEYLKLGVPPERLNVGVPYYSRGWRQVSGGLTELPGLYGKAVKGLTDTYGAPGIWDSQGRAAGCNPYYHIKANMENTGGYKKYWDPVAKVPYLWSESQKNMYTYEDEQSLGIKCDYVIDNGLGGIMFWELTGDYPSKGTYLTDLINKKFANVAPRPTSTPRPTNTPTPTATQPVNTPYKVTGYVDADVVYAPSVAAVVKSGFKVELVGSGLYAMSDSNGFFSIEVPKDKAGVYDIKISKASYLTRVAKNVSITGNKVLNANTSPISMWAGDLPVQDGAINMSDIVELIAAYNTSVGNSKYNADYDFDKDTAVNMGDITILIKHFNTTSENYPEIVVPTQLP